MSLYYAILIALGYIGFFLFLFRIIPRMVLPFDVSVLVNVIYYGVIGLTTYYVCGAVNRLPVVPDEPAAEAELQTPVRPPA